MWGKPGHRHPVSSCSMQCWPQYFQTCMQIAAGGRIIEENVHVWHTWCTGATMQTWSHLFAFIFHCSSEINTVAGTLCFYDQKNRFVGMQSKEGRTRSHFLGYKKPLFAIERERKFSFPLCTAWSSPALVLFHRTKSEWCLQEGWQRCWVALSLLCNSVFLEHGNGPALSARQCCEGQSILYWKDASSLLHWLIEIPGRTLSNGLFENRWKQAN